MTEQKIKKVQAVKVGGAVVGKPKTIKAIAAATAKKQPVKKPLADSPSAKKSTAKKTTTKSAVAVVTEPEKSKTLAVKKVAPSAAAKKQSTKKAGMPITRLSAEERYRMIETMAYFIAEQQGFNGHSDEHWVAAEREIASKLDLQC